MIHSDSIAALVAALAKAQGSIQGAKKDTENPFFKAKYADLASVWDACRSALSTNGLAVIQTTGTASSEGLIAVETMLAHSSGEWISSVLEVRPTKSDPQALGSAITYARRYALAAIVGVAPEDDDANAASQGAATTKNKVAPRPESASGPVGVDSQIDVEIRKGLVATGLKDGQLTKWAHDNLQTTSPWNKLTEDQKVLCFNYLKTEADKAA